MPTILVIDDNRAVSTALEVLFSLHDIDTLHAESPAAGLALLREQPVDLVIQDMNFSEDTTSGLEGEQLFADLRNEWPDMPVILLTAWTHLEAAVNLVRPAPPITWPSPGTTASCWPPSTRCWN